MTRFLPLVVIIAALVPQAAAADCALTGLQTTVITKQGAEIVGNGGVLVAATPIGRETQEKNPGNKPGWKLHVGDKRSAPKIDTIAPGLFVYRVPIESQTVPVEIQDEKGVVVAKVVGSKAKVAVYEAPKVTKVEYMNSGGRHSSQMLMAGLSAEPPAGTYALVVADAKGKAVSWYPVVAGGKLQHAFLHNDCQVLPDGMSSPVPGDKVTMFWVNTEGRVSDATKLISVGGKPNPY